MPLSKSEREEFLSEPHIAALSVFAGAERGPLTVPIWYQYTPGGEAWVLTGKTSKKAELIRAAGTFSLMVERVETTVRYVSVDGPVLREEQGTLEQLREMTALPRAQEGRRIPGVREQPARRERRVLPRAEVLVVCGFGRHL